MSSQALKIIRVQHQDNLKLLEIGYQTFYDAFGPPVNTEENIQEYLKEKFTLDQINKELAEPDSEFYFALIDTQIVGYIKVNFNDAQTEKIQGNGLEIERIYIVKMHQGKNFGQILFNSCLNIAENRNVDFIWLGVWDQNTRAIRFYERNNFKIFGKHQFVLGTEIQTDMMMRLDL
ncbi:N-acetyltransferase [Aquimarina sp. AU474]|uniref:GNAT family N-acetyltransferase n=1 Tax=Aquimarina sp. AU474 TaxID=2108529 RepID=UPI000D690A98|nr:GNAT family N-acetyltransferase [Aquimarina sp. AU474]